MSAADGPVAFQKDLYPALEKAGCRGCHTEDGVASGTRLRFPDPNATPEQVEAFGRSLVALSDTATPDNSLLLRKPTNRIAHAGGLRIEPGSAAEAALRRWINHLASLRGEELARALAYKASHRENTVRGAAIRRLTNSQYNRTVRDLLGDRTAPANQFPPEDSVNGFKNQYDAQNLSPLLLDAYSAAAERLAKNAFRGDAGQRLVGCKPSESCRTQFIRSFGFKAFRRPLTEPEQRRYEALFAKEEDFLSGARLVVEAMLQSPNFLFRLDAAPTQDWKSWAAASRLSYALWDTMPDDALFTSARNGELDTPNGLEKTVRRMLEDPRAKEAFDEFVSQWMRFDRALSSTRDRRKFPEYTAETAVAMTRETRAFLVDLAWSDANFMEFLTAPYAYPNGDLARLYGLPTPAVDFERTKLGAESERAGILGQALFLALTSKPDDTSPTARGLFVREQLLCQHVPDPPPGVNTNLPAVSETKPKSNRERLAEHTTNPSCAGCHALIDPIGFGFEKFDAVGARREKQRLDFGRQGRSGPRTSVEVPLDTRGNVAGIPGSDFSSPRELGAILAGSSVCQECVVKQYFRYVSGRTETGADRPVIRNALERFRTSGFRFRELVVFLMSAMQSPVEEASVRVGDHNQAR